MNINSFSSKSPYLPITSVRNPMQGMSAKVETVPLTSLLQKPQHDVLMPTGHSNVVAQDKAELKQLQLQLKSALTNKEYRFGAREGIMEVLHLDKAIKQVESHIQDKLKAHDIVMASKKQAQQLQKSVGITSHALNRFHI
jgi:hypothetical protein